MPLDGVILGHWVSEGGGSHLEGLPGLKEEEVLLEERRGTVSCQSVEAFPPAFRRVVCPGETDSQHISERCGGRSEPGPRAVRVPGGA